MIREPRQPEHLALGREGKRVFDGERPFEHPVDVVLHPRQKDRVSSLTVLAADLGAVAGQVKSANPILEQEEPRAANGQRRQRPETDMNKCPCPLAWLTARMFLLFWKTVVVDYRWCQETRWKAVRPAVGAVRMRLCVWPETRSPRPSSRSIQWRVRERAIRPRARSQTEREEPRRWCADLAPTGRSARRWGRDAANSVLAEVLWLVAVHSPTNASPLASRL